MEITSEVHDGSDGDKSLLTEQGTEEKPRAWELVEKGRYRPRRIKGSLLGRELG
jgi:hypothetical protein